MGKPFLFLYRALKNRRWVLWILLVLLLALAGNEIRKLRFVEDITRLIPVDEEMAEVQEVIEEAGFSDRIIFHIRKKKDSSVPTTELLKVGDSLVASLKRTIPSEWIDSVQYKVPQGTMLEVFDKVYEHLPIYLDKEEMGRLKELTRPDSIKEGIRTGYKSLMSPASMALKKFVIRDPIGLTPMAMDGFRDMGIGENWELHQGRIMTKDQGHLLFFLSPAFDPNETGRNAQLVEKVDPLVNSFNKGENGVVVDYFGTPPIAVANASRIKKDIALTVGIALLVLMVIIGMFYRKKRVFFLLFLPVIIGAAIALGSLAFWKGSVSAVSLGIGSVLLGITIDYSLHFFTHYRSTGSVKDTLQGISTPVLMSSLTTASAFACLFIVGSEALHDLGFFAAISVVTAALVALVLLPHTVPSSMKKANPGKAPLLERIASKRPDRSIGLAFGVVVISCGTYFFFGDVPFEEDLSRMNYMPEDLRKAEKELKEVSGIGEDQMFLVSSGKDLDEALNMSGDIKATLDSLEKEEVITKSGGVRSVIIPTEIQKERVERWNSYWTEERVDSVRSDLIRACEEVGFRPQAYQPFLDRISKKAQVVPVDSLYRDLEALASEFIKRPEDNGKVMVLSDLRIRKGEGGGLVDLFSNIEGHHLLDQKALVGKFIEVLKKDFDRLVTISLLIVFAILLIAFGRIELAFITFLPMALSWLWTLGIMGLFDISFNIFNIVVGTFVFGLGIDYSIFVTRGLYNEHKYGDQDLVSFKTSILFSVLTTMTGMGVLVFAQHPALRSIALVSVIGVCSTVLVSFILQPRIFDWAILQRKRKGHVPMSFLNFLISLAIFMVFLVGCVVLTLVGVIFLIPPYKKPTWRKHFYHTLLMYTCRFVIYTPFHIKKRISGVKKEYFDSPKVIISNHQSHIDLPLLLMLHPKIIVLTQDWVWNNPFYGAIVRLCDFYPVSWGYEKNLELLKERVKEGYSILVFPEGTRATDWRNLRRFHKGGFMLAEMLDLDILPIIIHGAGDCMPKGDNHLKRGTITVRTEEPLSRSSLESIGGYREQSKWMKRFYQEKLKEISDEVETPRYFRDLVIKNYIFKGPVLEWYVRMKLIMEDDYRIFDKFIPQRAKVLDVGCGFGYMTLMLQLLSRERRITAVDHDEEKIRVARNCPSAGNILFETGDAANLSFEEQDVIILGDLLHYLTEEDQRGLLDKCMVNLAPGGRILVRDADRDLEERHERSRRTEAFSTGTGFNKTTTDLVFLSGEELERQVNEKGFEVKVAERSPKTSNTLFVIEKADE